MYYIQGMTHSEIAKQMNVSRPTITRMLLKAKDERIVEIKINSAYRGCVEIADKIQRCTRIRDVLVVPSGKDIEETRAGVGYMAAQYLNDHLGKGDVLGLSWGKTLGCIAPYLRRFDEDSLMTVQLMGGLNTSAQVNPQQILSSISNALNARALTNYVPAVVDSKEIRKAILSDKNVQQLFKRAKETSVALLGIGDMAVSSLRQIGSLDEKEFLNLQGKGAVGDVLAWFYDIEGKRVHTSIDEKIMSVEDTVLKKISQKIGVTSGAYKCEAVVGALRGGWLDVLIIDEQLAVKVYDILKEE
jgi:DNA-binding transcriptional regulator LsrR (DeoR family)